MEHLSLLYAHESRQVPKFIKLGGCRSSVSQLTRVELLTFRGVICHWAARGETRVAELDLKTVQDGRAAALADKIWRMLLEARVAQPVTEAEAVRLARELYGIAATARALPGEYDDNFHLTSAAGREVVLKVMHPARERSFIELQSRGL